MDSLLTPQPVDRVRISSLVVAELIDEWTGLVVRRGEHHNLGTDVGDAYYAKKAGLASVNNASGMRYGTGTTTEAKAGAGAAIVTYVANSAKAFESGYPLYVDKGSGNGGRVSYQCLWPSGLATNGAVSEAVITNEASLSDAAGNAGNTLARVVFTTPYNKDSSHALRITWHHDFLAA